MSLKMTLTPRPPMLSMHSDDDILPPRSHFQSTIGAVFRFFIIAAGAMLILGIATA